MTQRVYGWKRDLPDPRDRKYAAQRRLVALPISVDLRPYCSPVEEQGSVGSCTGQAFAGVLEYLDRRNDGAHADVSRLFIYYNERKLENATGEDAGAYIRDGIKALKEWGACDEYLWPYDERRWSVEPSSTAYMDAMKRRIKTYARVTSLYDLKAALAEGLPVVFGFMVYESFDSGEVGKTGSMSMPEAGEELRGGHAVLAVGYDDATRTLIVRNSWGETWGDKGYFYMPYAYADDPVLSDDFWTVKGDGILLELPEDPLPPDTVWYVPLVNIVNWIWDWFSRGKK